MLKKTYVAFLFSIDLLASNAGKLFLWTFTRTDCDCDLKAQRKAWHSLQTLLRRHYPEFAGVRVFELHHHRSGHEQATQGLHVHVVTNRRIDVNLVRKIVKRTSGWGRIHVTKLSGESSRAAYYIGKYLGKKREECLHGWRLWGTFGFEGTRVKDCWVDALRPNIFRACYRDSEFIRLSWDQKLALVGFYEHLALLTGIKPRSIGMEEGVPIFELPCWPNDLNAEFTKFLGLTERPAWASAIPLSEARPSSGFIAGSGAGDAQQVDGLANNPF